MLSEHKKTRLKFIVIIFGISIFSLIFIIENFRDNMVFFYSPNELEKISNVKKIVKVGGLVKVNSVVKKDALNTDFVITDLKKDLLIHYRGILPDLFREKQGVVASGFVNAEKTEFTSRELLIKHDENYMPPEVAESLKSD